jgi:hypothetical protein
MKTVIHKIFFFLFLGLSTSLAQAQTLKNHLEILHSLAFITGINQTNPAVNETYQLVKDTLPHIGVASEFNESLVIALYKLSYKFCVTAYERELKLPLEGRWLYLNYSIEIPLSNWSTEAQKKLINELAQQFYTREIEENELSLLIGTLSYMTAVNLPVDQVYSSLCAMIASSPEFILKR